MDTNLERDASKFYEKIRGYVKQIESSRNKSSKKDKTTTEIASYSTNLHMKEEKIFGQITEQEMRSILDSYDKQQSDTNTENKPVSCDQVMGGSFEKLLFAKPGFHYFGSTDILAKDLSIEDNDRISFLGDLNFYDIQEGEDIVGLKKKYNIRKVEEMVKSARAFLADGRLNQARDLIDQALILEPNSGLAFMAKGQFHDHNRDYQNAVDCYKKSLEHGVADTELTKKHLSNSLFQQAMLLYNRQNWSKAWNLFDEALKYDRENGGASLHIQLCQDKMRRPQNPFRPQVPRYRK